MTGQPRHVVPPASSPHGFPCALSPPHPPLAWTPSGVTAVLYKIRPEHGRTLEGAREGVLRGGWSRGSQHGAPGQGSQGAGVALGPTGQCPRHSAMPSSVDGPT